MDPIVKKMDYDINRDLFLLNIKPLVGYDLVKICDENIYVDNDGAPLRVIQYFYFQLVRLVQLYLERNNKKIDNDDSINKTYDNDNKGEKIDILIYEYEEEKYKYAVDENGINIIINTDTNIPLNKIDLRDYILNKEFNDKIVIGKEKHNKLEKYGLKEYGTYPIGYTKFKLRLNKDMDDVVGWDEMEEDVVEIIMISFISYLRRKLSELNVKKAKAKDTAKLS